MRRLIYAVPVLAFAGIAYFLFASLKGPPPDFLPSALIGKPAPRLALPPLDAAAASFSPRDLASGHVSVVNIFASWCAPCRTEGPQLAAVARLQGVALYGIVQKDKPAAARAFLDQYGDPYARIALDADGRAGIEWGVYGVPETFVVDGQGIVRLRLVGALTPQALSDELLPAIEQARSK